MRFESYMTCEVFVSDGNYTIGYVDGEPAEWDGGNIELSEGGEFRVKQEGNIFGVNFQDEYIVEDNLWKENIK